MVYCNLFCGEKLTGRFQNDNLTSENHFAHCLNSRGERERTTEVETKSAKKFMSMARRRKRSPFQSVKNNI